MQSRKAISPVVASIMLIAASLFLGVWIGSLYKEMAYSNVKTKLLRFDSAYCTQPVSVENARWQIAIMITSVGTESIELSYIFLNEKPADVYGLIHGDSLINGSLVGTSLPEGGLVLEAGESTNVYLWVGDKLLSSGTEIVIHFNDINSVALKRFVKLT
jgi:hypothetical protein